MTPRPTMARPTLPPSPPPLSLLSMLRLAIAALLVSVALDQLATVGVSASSADCGSPVDYSIPPSPRTLLPLPALATLNTSAFAIDACTLSFDQLADGHSDWAACHHVPLANVHTCPQDCLQAVRISPANATVLGSGPYHPNSSVCLAAIHAGVIDASTGGATHVGRFYPIDWSDSDTQSLYPGRAALGSSSHGVTSLPVPAADNVTPAPQSSHSWSVRPRGVLPRQVQRAPFPPRSGHLHAVLYPQLLLRANWSLGGLFAEDGRYQNIDSVVSHNYSLHFVIGGRNATHYLNDVWLFHSLTGSAWDDYSALNRFSSRNGRWARLPDAPFTPRADMLHHIIVDPDYENWNNVSPSAQRIVLLVMGGETGYACGNRHLGTCENDVWHLSIVRPAEGNDSAILDLGPSFQWQRQSDGSPGDPVVRLPFSPRCGMSPMMERRTIISFFSRLTGVIGGQLSYSDTATCTAPIVTLNEVWSGVWPYTPPDLSWDRNADAPFAPRRSMLLEDSTVSTDELTTLSSDNHIDKTLTLAGGITYLSHRFDAQLNRSVTTQAEVHADMWSCNMDWMGQVVDCDWFNTFPMGRLRTDDSHAAPSGSLPVPVAFGTSAAYPFGAFLLNTRIGGAVPAAALRDWNSTPLRSSNSARESGTSARQPHNVTLMQQPNSLFSRLLPQAPTLAEVQLRRYGLPLSYVVDEAELNSPSSSFALGSDLVVTHAASYSYASLKPVFTSVGDGTQVGATGAADVAVRRRLGHAMGGTWDTAIISGGHSGDAYSSDWISYEAALCWWPEDPSYLSELGAVRYVSLVDITWRYIAIYRYWTAPGVLAASDEHLIGPAEMGAFRASQPIEAECAPGWHWDPPLPHADSVAVLTCSANSQWVDVGLGGVRRCVVDQLRCPYPLVDAGYGECSEPVPLLESASVYNAHQYDPIGRATNVDSATVTDMEWISAYSNFRFSLQLVLRGQWLTEPVLVEVGGHLCGSPQLRNVTRYCSVSDSGQTSCLEYGDSIVCVLDEASLGTRAPVIVDTGRGVRRRSISSIRVGLGVAGRELITLSVSEPRVVFVYPLLPGTCDPQHPDKPWQLTGCSSDRPLSVLLCGTGYGIARGLSDSTLGAPITLTYAGALVRCSGWFADGILYDQTEDCDSPLFPCYVSIVCGTCTIPIRSGVSAAIALTAFVATADQQRTTNAQQNSNASTAATIGFRLCDRGTMLTINASASINREQCMPCPAGYSTANATGQMQCQPCPPGTFANATGSVDCEPCPINTHASTAGSTACDVCDGNTWQPFSRQSECISCKANEYRVQLRSTAAANSTAAAHAPDCLACPATAACYVELSTVVATTGAYLLADRVTGAVSSVDCNSLACVESADGMCGTDAVGTTAESNDDAPSAWKQRVEVTGITVINCCGPHRRPADPSSPTYANVLCAECEDGYAEISGECVACASTNWAALFGLVLLALLIVYLLHRLSSQSDTSATTPILVYAVQMSILFMSTQRLPSFMQLLEVNLLDNTASCVVPLSGLGKLMARLLSPLLAVGLLGVLLGVHLSLRHCLRDVAAGSVLSRAYRVLFVDPLVTLPASAAPSDDGDGYVRHSPQPVAVQLSRVDAVGQQWKERLLDTDDGHGDSEELKEQDAYRPAAHSQPLEIDRADAGSEPLPALLHTYRRTLLRLLFYSYNAISTACLAFFTTRAVGEYGYRVRQYPSIDTDAAAYKSVSPLMIALLVFPVLSGPLLLFGLLVWQRRRQLWGGQQSDAEQVDSANLAAPSLLSAMLTTSLRPGCWPMGAAIIARRLVLILILNFAEDAVWVWASMACFLILSLHLLIWPYLRRRDNLLEAVGLLCLSLQACLLASPTELAGLSAMLWLLMCTPVATLIGLRVAERWRGRMQEIFAAKVEST